jgi:predicted RNA-binding protein with PIN domain
MSPYNTPMPYWFDGNNLIGQPAAVSSSRPQLQRAFLSALSDYHKSGGGRFLVYFDGDDSHGSIPPAGIRVRYSAPLSADDAIIQSLQGIHRPGEVIIVSNDRALQSRCRTAGATALNWQQFASKMESRKKLHAGKIENQPPVDVEDWMDYFGLDKSKM